MRVVIDCDPGNGVAGSDIDDGLAIALALTSPELDLEAITVVGGNTPVETGVRSALGLLEAASADTPVFAGAARPLVEDPRPWRAELDGRAQLPTTQRLWREVEIHPSAREPERAGAAQALVEAVASAPGEVTVVAVGPLTNVAHAILLDPAFARAVSRIVIMGGGFGVPDVLQELNFGYDPEAAHLVLTSGAPVTLVPLDVTLQTFFRLADVEQLDAADNDLARYLGKTVRPWVQWLAETINRDGCPLHDPLAVATLLDDSIVTTRDVCVDVELHGTLTRSRPVTWDPQARLSPSFGLRLPDVRPIRLVTGVDNDAFVRLLLARLAPPA